MERDVIVFFSTCDYTFVTVNSKYISSAERAYEMGCMMRTAIEHMKYDAKPIIVDIYQEDVDLTDSEMEALYERDDEDFFYGSEIEILKNEGIDAFIPKLKENLAIRASEIDKAIQEM